MFLFNFDGFLEVIYLSNYYLGFGILVCEFDGYNVINSIWFCKFFGLKVLV